MDVYIEKENIMIKSDAETVNRLLKELKINPTTVIVSKNGELVTESEKLSGKDKIKIFPVISGG